MATKRPLAPALLNKLDDYLLRNRPATWSARAHLALYYGLLYIAVICFFGFVSPNDPRKPDRLYLWVTFVSILSLIAIIVWVIYLLRFNVFKRFGIQHSGDGIKALCYYFLSIGIFVAAPFVPSVIESIRANASYTRQELVTDVNTINKNLLLLEHDSIPLRWNRSTYKALPGSPTELMNVAYDSTYGSRYLTDTAILRSKIQEADSLVVHSDSSYTVFECPQYRFVSGYFANYLESNQEWDDRELYQNVLAHYQGRDSLALIKELEQLQRKYLQQFSQSIIYLPDDAPYVIGETDNQHIQHISNKYQVYEMDRAINNIYTQKYRWRSEAVPGFIRLFFYITLSLSLLVFLFRHSTRRSFFIAMLAGVLLAIFTGVVYAAIPGNNSPYLGFIFYYIAFAVIVWVGIQSRVRGLVSGVALNLLCFFAPYLPLLLMAYYLEEEEAFRRLRELPIDYERQKLLLGSAEIGGILLFLLLLEPVFKRLYRRWYALPDQ